MARTTFRGRILHGDDFGGVADFNGQRLGAGMVRQLLADHLFRPTRMTRTSSSDAARIAPSTSALGAWSPPIASTAIVSMGARAGYSSTTSTTSRPLYFPQRGHTRCGSLGSWQLGHSDRTERVSES